jgi:hypothetical protein
MTPRLTRVLPLIVAPLVILAAACGDDGDDTTSTADTVTTDSTTTTVAGTATTAAPATTVAPATTAAPPTTMGDPGDDALPTDPQTYATAFVGAWAAGDEDSALVFGTASAVDAIFAYDSGGPGAWSVTGCEGAAGSTYCTFTAGGDPTIVVRVGNEAASQGQHQAVTEVQITS